MTDMIEIVARAICKSRTCEGTDCCQWPSNMGRTRCPVKQGGYNDAAREAIAAMQKPTNEMLEHAKPYMDSWSSNLEWWHAMIEQAGRP